MSKVPVRQRLEEHCWHLYLEWLNSIVLQPSAEQIMGSRLQKMLARKIEVLVSVEPAAVHLAVAANFSEQKQEDSLAAK